QARNDWTSVLEDENNSNFYPSASISFVPTDAFPSLQSSTVLNYLKFRAGYGTSAGYPGPYQTRNVLSTSANVFLTPGGTTVNTNSVSNRLGNPNLGAEKHSELEFGIEARFLQNRIGIDASYYNKQSTDLIIDLDLDPATGYTNTTVNAAEVENNGIELGINLVPVKGEFTWDMTLNYTKNNNDVISIAEGVDQVVISGYTNLGNFAIPGEPYGVIQGIPFQKNADGELLVAANGEYIAGPEIVPIGNPNPNYTANWINSFSWKGLSLGFQWSYQDGGDIVSLPVATMLARGLTEDTNVDRFLPIIAPGVLASDESTPNNIQHYIGDLFFNAFFFADEGTTFDGTVIRLREVSLSYEIPQSVLERLPIGSASIILSGQNLWYNAPNFPEGINYDPEVLSLGVGNGRGFDYITGPTSKKYGVTLNLTF
ncbi:MAG: TonB-dependent receptor, partial [Saprospiraceae bacterium]|nr:TonB-dependent receptor [Saprospiraceae bacterium]